MSIPCAAAGDWVPRAFDGGTVTALCHRGDTLYAGTLGGGIYLSGNGGRDWRSLLKPGSYLETRLEIISMAATSHDLIILTPNAGYRLRSGETIWTVLHNPTYPTAPFTARKLVSDGERVAALASSAEFFLSVDGGESWSSLKAFEGTQEPLTDLALAGEGILAVTAGKVIASADAGGTWKLVLGEASAKVLDSRDGSAWIATPQKLLRAAWTDLLLGTSASPWTAIEPAGIPANRRELTAAAEVQGRLWVAAGNSLYLSKDASGTFQAVAFPSGADPGRIATLLPSENGIVTGCGLEGIIRAAPGNAAVFSNVGLYNRTVSALARERGRLYAAVQDRGLFISADTGHTWDGPAAGLRVDSKPAVFLHAFGALYFCQGNGISRIGGDGEPPIRLSDIPGSSFLVAVESHKGSIFAATATDGLYLSRDSGLTWVRPNPDTGWNMTGLTLKDLASNGRTLFAVGAGQFRSQLYRSLDDGASWEFVNARESMDDQDSHSIHVMGDTVFAGTTWDLYASGDEGKTWKRREVFAYTSSVVDRIVSDGDFMLAASRNSGAAISRDRGRTWDRLDYYSTHLTSGLALNESFLFGTDGLSLLAWYPNGAPPESILRRPRAHGTKPARHLLVSTDGRRKRFPQGPIYDIHGACLRPGMNLPPGVFILAPEHSQ